MNYVSSLMGRVSERGKSSIPFYELDTGVGVTCDELCARVKA